MTLTVIDYFPTILDNVMREKICFRGNIIVGCDNVSIRQRQAYFLLTIILLTVVAITIFNYKSSKGFVLETVQKDTRELLESFTDETDKFSNERVAEL